MGTYGKDQCGYCHHRHSTWETSPHGRKYCPNCGAIKKSDQRDHDAPLWERSKRKARRAQSKREADDGD